MKNVKLIGFLGAFLLTFGITGFDFDVFMSNENLIPGGLMLLGVVALILFWMLKSKARNE